MERTVASQLFADLEETLIWSCLEGFMGQVILDDTHKPQSALALIGRRSGFAFLAGLPNRDLLAFCEQKDVILVPQTSKWARMIEKVYGDRVYSFTRYATKKDTNFHLPYLGSLLNSLPPDMTLLQIDEALYHTCLAMDWSYDLVGNYTDFTQFRQFGLGYVICQNGEVVAGASSYASYSGGIEIEVDTCPEYRRQGLAKICSAALILDCLKRGLYPSWDAHTLISLRLAETLGYEYSHSYQAYEWR